MLRFLPVVLVLMLASCGGEESSAISTSDQNAEPAAVTAESPADVSAEPETTAREPLAFGIARYPGSVQLGDAPDLLAENKDQNVRWLQFETTDEPAKVIAFYKAEAGKAGMTVTEESEKRLAKSMLLKAERPQGGFLKVSTMLQPDGKVFIDVRIGEDL